MLELIMNKNLRSWRNTGLNILSKIRNIFVDTDPGEELHLDLDEPLSLESQEFFKGVDKNECPQLHDVTRVCVCVDCPKRGKCWPERLCKASGCQGYVLSCSLRSEVTSGTSPLFGKFVCEEWGSHLKRKFLKS